MINKWLAWPLLCVLLLVLAWLYRVPLGLASGPALTDISGAAAVGRLLEPMSSKVSPSAPAPATGGVRKCIVKGEVLYTNSACPAGSREQAASAGTVSVLSAPASPASSSAAQRPAHVRELLIKPDEVNIKDKRMEEIIGK